MTTLQPHNPTLAAARIVAGLGPSNLVPHGQWVEDPAVQYDVHTLSPDSLMVYLQTRLDGLDLQIDEVFEKQQKNEKIRHALLELHRSLGPLNEHADDPNAHLDMPAGTEEAIRAQIDAIIALDPELGAKIEGALTHEGQILWAEGDVKYTAAELNATVDYLNSINKELESRAQLDMIRLQSLMSSRQTAIQLSTNLIASWNDSQKAIVTNIR